MNLTAEDLIQAINGFATYRWGMDGSVIPLQLDSRENKIYRDFVSQGYAIKKGRVNVFTAYSAWCSIEKKPQVFIRPKIKYAHVEVDMIFSDYRVSVEGQKIINSVIKNNCPKKYEKYELGNIGGTYSFCQFIIKEKAEIVARKIVEITKNEKYLIPNSHYQGEYKKTLDEYIREKIEQYRKIGNKKEGYVYFVQAENRSIFKIGFSRNHPKNRMKSLQNGSPYDLYLRYFFYSIDCEEAESKVHKYFANAPKKREWFFVSAPQIIKAIWYFESSLDVALESNHFDVISSKYLVLKSKLLEDATTVVTEKCPFCGRKHHHGTGGKDYMRTLFVKDEIKTLGHRSAHCSIKNIEFILPNGTIVNNDDGYYLGL